jgi:hypothetical protein
MKMILLEFNELCPPLLEKFMAMGELPNFKKMFDASTVYTTDAKEQDPNLEPWIQWLSVHSGVPYSEHSIFNLGDGHKYKQKMLAEILSDAGVHVGVMSSMNTNYTKLNGYMVPDPWDKNSAPYPENLRPFYNFVASKVQESSRDDDGANTSATEFGKFLLRNGLSFKTAITTIKQLIDEKRDNGVTWRRPSTLDFIQYDVAKSLNKHFDVEFATFFCNSVAHYQHYYWRNMEPEQFDVPPADSEHESLKTAILYGYKAQDEVIGQFMKDYPDALLVLCTALSQQPWTDTTKCTYRPSNFEALLNFAGVDTQDVSVKPVMAEQFHIDCASAEQAKEIADKLTSLKLEGEQAIGAGVNGDSVFAGCRLTNAGLEKKSLKNAADNSEVEFGKMFYMIHSMRSGKHHPDGVLWIMNGKHKIVNEKISLMSIAPTILSYFNVPTPDYMHESPLNISS